MKGKKLIELAYDIRQFITFQARYLVKAAQLPPEFETELLSVFEELKDHQAAPCTSMTKRLPKAERAVSICPIWER